MALVSTGVDYAQKYTDLLNQLGSNTQYTPQYTDRITGYTDLLAAAAANGYTDPYLQQRQETAQLLGSRAAYDDPYTDTINGLLASMNGYGSYESPYDSALTDILNRQRDYGTYESPYAQNISDLTGALLNSKFTYDPASDPNYQALRKQYLIEADRTASDVLAKASASTGGRASSYAVSAASQAADYYKSQLSAQQQALFDSAYQRYYSDYAQRLGLLQELAAQDETEYGRWQDAYSRLLDSYSLASDRDDTAYSRWQDEYTRLYNTMQAYGSQSDRAEAQYEAENDRYAQFLDALTALSNEDYGRWYDRNQLLAQLIGDYQTQEQLEAGISNQNYANLLDQAGSWGDAEAQANTERNEAYQRLLNRLLSYGAIPYDYELEEAGMSRAEAEKWRQYYLDSLAAGGTAYSGSGSYGTSTGGFEFDLGGTGDTTAAQQAAAYSTAYSQNDYWNIYQQSGLTAAENAAKSAVSSGLLTRSQAESVISAIRNYDKIKAAGAKTTTGTAASGTSTSSGTSGKTVSKTSSSSSSTAAKTTAAKSTTATAAKSTLTNTRQTK